LLREHTPFCPKKVLQGNSLDELQVTGGCSKTKRKMTEDSLIRYVKKLEAKRAAVAEEELYWKDKEKHDNPSPN
jgi:hypothetical protein